MKINMPLLETPGFVDLGVYKLHSSEKDPLYNIFVSKRIIGHTSYIILFSELTLLFISQHMVAPQNFT